MTRRIGCRNGFNPADFDKKAARSLRKTEREVLNRQFAPS